MNKLFTGIAALLIITLLSACNRDDKPTPVQPDKAIIALGTKTTSAGVKVILYAYGPAKTGYNKLFVGLRLNGSVLIGADVTFEPLMEMNNMVHGSPVEQPVVDSNLAAFSGAVVFTMPSSADAKWTLKIHVDNDVVSFPLVVSESEHKVTGSYTGTDSNHYVLTLLPKKSWKVGLNDFELLINRQITPTSYVAVNDLAIDFNPVMPAMGHSSPNNVNPTSTGDGHYEGTANLTMTGDWRLNFKLKRNDTVIVPDAYVEIQF